MHAMAASGADRAAGEDSGALARVLSGLAAGTPERTIAACEDILSRAPESPPAMFALGLAAVQLGDLAAAVGLLLRAHDGDRAEALYAEALATVYALAGQLADAVFYAKLSAACGLDERKLSLLPPWVPRFADVFVNIKERPLLARAQALMGVGDLSHAAAGFQQHLAFETHSPEAWRGLAAACRRLGRPHAMALALGALEETGGTTPADLVQLGHAYTELGDFDDAQSHHRRAIAERPNDAAIAAAGLCDKVFFPASTAASLSAEAKAWAERFAPADRAGGGGGRDEGPIRVGFLCTEFRDARDMDVLALVAKHGDRTRMRLHGYGRGTLDDAANRALRGAFEVWRDAREFDAATLAAIVAGDGIEVLIDAGGHAAPNHLAAMARRPAAVQASWLGNPVTTGLRQVAYSLSDHASDPEGQAEALYAEALLRLPHGTHCYSPPESPIAGADTGAEIRFGADVSLAQLHPDAVGYWAELLAMLPRASLVLRDRDLSEPANVERLVRRFSPHGVADRIDIAAAGIDAFYGGVDIALAGFVAANPHETAEALARGVPVIALAGSGRHRRQASGLLSTLGLEELVAADGRELVAIGAHLATSSAARAEAREAVARAVRTSPIFRPEAFARDFESAIAEMARPKR